MGELLKFGSQIEGLRSHASVGASGVVIANGSLENIVPVYTAKGGQVITQYEMRNTENVGLVKFDLLGLKTLTLIKRAVDLIRQNSNRDFSIDAIDIGDNSVYRQICSGDTVGIFQLENSGIKEFATRLKPSCYEDIIALPALYRPGPLDSGMVDDFIERKHGRKKITYLLPQLEPILRGTYGIILYQEQMLQIGVSLANYSLGEADLLRRTIGKKKPNEMAMQLEGYLVVSYLPSGISEAQRILIGEHLSVSLCETAARLSLAMSELERIIEVV